MDPMVVVVVDDVAQLPALSLVGGVLEFSLVDVAQLACSGSGRSVVFVSLTGRRKMYRCFGLVS